jgi:hypothetical protein
MFKHKRILIATIVIVTAVIFFIGCINNKDNKVADLRGPNYAGEKTCITCHKNIYDSYLHTAHQNTSILATAETILGSFASPNNDFFFNPMLKISMEKTDSGFYQVEYDNGIRKEAHRFDIAVGSGRKAQTYLYHAGDEIHQLPISYFVPSASWANSPGFPANHPLFDRVIPSGCFGCHASAANVNVVQTGSLELTEKYLPNEQLLGIDCERCHGPAQAHVDYHTAHPEAKIGKYITDIRTLTRNQQMDLCAVCHSGRKKAIQPIFTFKPGSNLNDFYYLDAMNPSANKLDVHGTEVQYIMASQCYLQSKTLTCISCHNPHQKERENIAVFSQRCMNCHTEVNHNFCKMAPELGEAIKTNCIDCHMPAKPSKVIQLLTNGKESPLPDYIRTHIVAVYPADAKKVLAAWKDKN